MASVAGMTTIMRNGSIAAATDRYTADIHCEDGVSALRPARGRRAHIHWRWRSGALFTNVPETVRTVVTASDKLQRPAAVPGG